MRNERRSPLEVLIIDGILIMLPVVLIIVAFEKVYKMLKKAIGPVVGALPGAIFHEPVVRGLLVIAVIVMLLMLFGLLAHVGAGRKIGHWFEGAFLKRLPFYGWLRNLAFGLAGKEDEQPLKTVLVTVEDGVQQWGLLMERHADGSGTVFLPSAPNPGSGTVVVMDASRIREVPIPAATIFISQPLGKWHG